MRRSPAGPCYDYACWDRMAFRDVARATTYRVFTWKCWYSLSLLELAALSGEERFRQAALAAMAYERSLFSPEYQNWPDLRPLGAQGSSENMPMVTWCH